MSKELTGSIDVTGLVEYTNKISDIGTMNKILAPDYLRDFINAMDLTSTMLSRAVKSNLESKAKLEKAKAIAYLDTAEGYLKAKGIKISNGAREMYVDLMTKSSQQRTNSL